MTAMKYILCPLAFIVLLMMSKATFGQGITVTGVGPVNRSMGGAGTAAPLDAMGALNWNPGSISALPSNESSFGVELLWPSIELSSNLGVDISSQGGIATVPSIGWVHHLEDSRATIGLGVYAVGGFKNNLPANPLLGGSSGFASAEILQIAPTLSYALTDFLAIGIAPTVTTASVIFDPLGPSVITPTPTPGQGNRTHWGGGVQAGIYYIGANDIHLGFTYKTKQWIEDLQFLTPGGTVVFDLDYPPIVSFGFGYSGIDNWTIAMDARYFDYANTDGFSALGWRSTFAGAVGFQYQFSNRLDIRFGYNYNQSPIRAGAVAANIISPLIQEHNASFGTSFRFTDNVDFNFAYVYLFENNETGPLPTPPFPPGATANHKLTAQSLIMGVKVRY